MIKVPVIDIFAGPGGLSEGFCKYKNSALGFRVRLSIEKDAVAHRTLLLRAFTRQFDEGELPEEYYRYIRGEIKRDELFEAYPDQTQKATSEAWLAELGETPRKDVHRRIRKTLKGADQWVLIGGPPCQAYSLIGRSRMLGRYRSEMRERAAKNVSNNGDGLTKRQANLAVKEEEQILAKEKFHEDHRHKLYKQYLEIVAVHQPTVFVMENVKGILSSKFKSRDIFDRILEDLKKPWNALDKKSQREIGQPKTLHRYEIYSFTVPLDDGGQHSPQDYIIKSEAYGVPQKRHRVILLGIRKDVSLKPGVLEKAAKQISVSQVIGDLPKLRSHISRRPDQFEEWVAAIKGGVTEKFLSEISNDKTRDEITVAVSKIGTRRTVGSAFKRTSSTPKGTLKEWYADPKIKGVIQHRARGHMASDLLRYLFAAATAKASGRSPTLYDYPAALLPKHHNTESLKEPVSGQKKSVIFEDRFRVQVAGKPASTITSHISQDGHYYIHYDPAQCRSLTPREAARIQTFPDNYFFEGNRTQQYQQVGNAVPPYLATQLACVVADLLCRLLEYDAEENLDD